MVNGETVSREAGIYGWPARTGDRKWKNTAVATEAAYPRRCKSIMSEQPRKGAGHETYNIRARRRAGGSARS